MPDVLPTFRLPHAAQYGFAGGGQLIAAAVGGADGHRIARLVDEHDVLDVPRRVDDRLIGRSDVVLSHDGSPHALLPKVTLTNAFGYLTCRARRSFTRNVILSFVKSFSWLLVDSTVRPLLR